MLKDLLDLSKLHTYTGIQEHAIFLPLRVYANELLKEKDTKIPKHLVGIHYQQRAKMTL